MKTLFTTFFIMIINLNAFTQDCKSIIMPDSLLLSNELNQTKWINYTKYFGLRLTQEKDTNKIKLSIRSHGGNFVAKNQQVTFLFSNNSQVTITFDYYHYEHKVFEMPGIGDIETYSEYMYRNSQYISTKELDLFKSYQIIEVKHTVKPKKRKKIEPDTAKKVQENILCFINNM